MSAAALGAVFVGRERELDVLAAHLAAQGRTSSGVLLISGPAGVGKTTLVDQAVRAAAAPSVVRGYCPAEPAPPLWPWRAALSRAGVRRAGAEIADGPDIEPAAAASARFAALAQLSDALIAAGPLTVVLEDLHWADAASLDLLAQVGAAPGGTRVTVVGTVRSPPPQEVGIRLAGLGRYGAVTLPLAPFTPGEVAELVDPDLVSDVYQRTGGLPLLVAAVRAGSGSADLAVVVGGLLAALTPVQREIVEAAAVVGEVVDDHLLAAVVAGRHGAAPAGPAAWHDDSVANALDAAWHNGLLTVDDATRRYRFAHALVRDGIVDRLDPATARALHRAAALALESSADAGRAGRVAAHWRHAGTDPGTRRAAAGWARKAAEQARTARAYDDAARLLAGALADISAVEGDSVERAEVLLELAHAEYLAGRYGTCLEHCADAADAAAAAGRGDLVARSALILQGVTYPQAAEVLTRLGQHALAYADLGIDLRARVLAQLATMEADSGRVAAGEALAREALALAAESGDPLAEIEAARAREMTLVHPGDTPERMRLGDLVADRAEALGQPLAALIGHEWRIHAAYLSARLDVVGAAAGAIERLARRSALPLAQWHLHRLRASRTILTGQFAESSEHSRRAFAIARDSGDQTALSMHFAHGIRLALLRGDPASLPGGFREVLAAAPSMPLVDVERANVLALTGSLPEARSTYDRLCDLLPYPTDHPAWAAVLTQMVELIQRFGDAAAAEIVYRQLLPFRPYPGALGTCTVYFLGTISRNLGELAEVFGDKATAIELLREALPRNRAIGARPDTALTSLGLARLLRDGDRAQRAEAAALAQDALDVATRLDMPGPVAAAGRLAAQLAADREDADPLTGREREVAVLLTEALSNRQIAARLVLSERTVESHVRSILAKTQCANRTEFVTRWTPS